MNELNETLILRILISPILFLAYPIIQKYILHKTFNRKQARKIAILNSVILYVIFLFLYIINGLNSVPNIAPYLFWGFLNYYMLYSHKALDDNSNFNSKEELDNQEDLNNLINSLEKHDNIENK